jgi:hypothetical protein
MKGTRRLFPFSCSPLHPVAENRVTPPGAFVNNGRSAFLDVAEGLGLGVAAREKIEIADVSLG